MRKLSIMLVALACIGFVTSCNEGGMSAKTKKNLEVNDAIMKAYESGDFTKMKEYLAEDAVDHAGEAGDIKGADNIIAEMKRYKQLMPDMKAGNSLSVGNDEYVFTRSTVSGTMNGQPINVTSVDVSRFVDGKAAEHWIYMNPADMMAMLQPAPMPADSIAKPDSTKK